VSKKINAVGARESYATGKLAELAPIKKAARLLSRRPFNIQPQHAEPIRRNYGSQIVRQWHTGQDTVITNRMQVDRTGASDA
jgi:hypothetical protein